MPDKPPEAGKFPRREQAARETRQRLVRAAAELFIERGYIGTTVSAVAQRAGVGRATVFTSVPGGKPELLKLARDVALAGDDEPVPVSQRPWFLSAMAATDPGELLRRQARNYAMINRRVAAIASVLMVGAADAPELAELEQEARRQRAFGCRMVIDRLVELGAISPTSRRSAADSLYALAAPDVYLLLTRDRRWSVSRYEKWLSVLLIAELLQNQAGSSG